MTLIELLERVAKRVDCIGGDECVAPGCAAKTEATRLRSAAARLRDEMEKVDKGAEDARQGGDHRIEDLYLAQWGSLTRINGGPVKP